MKHLKTLGLAALAALALTASLGASSASATTLETTGVTTNSSETITASLEAGTSSTLSLTGGGFANTCTEAHVQGRTTSFTGASIGGPIENMWFEGCTRLVMVHQMGSFYVEHIASTTNATLRSWGAWVTVGSPIGTLSCKTGEGTHLGTVTGSKHLHATIHINAVLNCGFLAPSANWNATYIATSPTGLGVSA